MDIDKKKQLILRQGRPLDAARILYAASIISSDDLLAFLKPYQNEDGGFGHGLESDCTNPNSSPISSWVATEILFELQLHRSQAEMTEKLDGYLRNEWQKTEGQFWLTQPSNNEYPCAPWWNHSSPPWVSAFNPAASLNGYLYVRHQEDHVKDKIDQLVQLYLKQTTMEMHDLSCMVRLYEYLESVDDVWSKDQNLISKLVVDIEAACQDFEISTEYHANPVQMFLRLNHPLALACKNLIERQCQHFKNEFQRSEWIDLTWTWDASSEAFIRAKRAWQSQLTYNAVRWIEQWKEVSYD